MSWAGKLSPLAVLRHTVRVVGSVPRSGPPRREAVSLEVAAEACGVPPEQMFVWELGYQALTLAEVEMLAGLYRQPLHLVARAAAETYRGASESVVVGALRAEVREERPPPGGARAARPAPGAAAQTAGGVDPPAHHRARFRGIRGACPRPGPHRSATRGAALGRRRRGCPVTSVQSQRLRADLARELGISPYEAAHAMETALDGRAPVVAARLGRRVRTVEGWSNAPDVDLVDDDEDAAPGQGPADRRINPLVELVLAMGAAMRDGVSRERALAPLDYAERVFDRLGVDRPASLLNPRGPRPVSLEAARPVLASPAPARMALDLVEQLAAALAGSCDWSAQLSQILADVADGHLSPEESRRVDLIRSQADRAAASILHVQHLLAEVGAVLGPGRGRDGSGVRTPGRAG